jgi:hypothetical protein
VLTKDKRTGARMKDKIPLTLNPGTKTEANQKHKPFTTKEKAPKLTKFSGIDRAKMAGLTAELTIPRPAAAKRAAGNVAKLTPGKIISTTNRLRAVASNVKRVPSIISPQIYKFLELLNYFK